MFGLTSKLSRPSPRAIELIAKSYEQQAAIVDEFAACLIELADGHESAVAALPESADAAAVRDKMLATVASARRQAHEFSQRGRLIRDRARELRRTGRA